MTVNVELPEALAERLAAEAARRGVTVEDLAVETLESRYGREASARREHTPEGADALEAFIGSFDSGDPDWASTNTHELRAQAEARRHRAS